MSSRSTTHWREQLGVAGVLAGVAALIWLGSQLTPARQMVLWGLLVLALVALARRGWVRLFGPVFYYDLLRSVRKNRTFVYRFCYASGLAVVIGWIYFVWIVERRGRMLSVHDMPQFAASFSYTFICVQFALAALLTPAVIGGAIADEKDRRTLEFMLATDLRDREIVFGKLGSRLAMLLLFLLTGLPVLSILQFLGGVDPELLLASFTATGLTMCSLAGVGIFNSALAKKPRDAIALTYLVGAGYLAISGLAWMVLFIPGIAAISLPVPGVGSITLQDLVAWFNAGNVIAAFVQLMNGLDNRSTIDKLLPALLRNYAIFHGLVAIVFTTLAVWRLRPLALKQSYGQKATLPLVTRFVGRPPMGSSPMLWKEIFAEPGLRLNWLGRILILLLALGSFAPAVYIIAEHTVAWLTGSSIGRWRDFGQEMNFWVRLVGTTVACLTLLGVAVRASGIVSGERDRQTLDSLMTSPLNTMNVIFAKWVGNVLSVRKGWIWLGLIWLLGLVTGGLHILALPVLLTAWFIYAGVFSALGMWCSAACRTTLRATIWTLTWVLAISVGHWMLTSMGCYIPLASAGANSRSFEWLLKVQAGQTPPFVLGFLQFHGEEFERPYSSSEAIELCLCCVFGLACWTVLAVILWFKAHSSFCAMTGRGPFRRPERQDPKRFALRRPHKPRSLPAAVGSQPILDVIPVDDSPSLRQRTEP
jgi:ABC-type transport system involved in multi-copper enzyme maturation permease subunit